MKKLILSLFLISAFVVSKAQRKQIDSLKAALERNPAADTARLNILNNLGSAYFIPKPDSAIIFALQAYELAVKFKLPIKQADASNTIGNSYSNLADYVKAIQFHLKALRTYESVNYVPGIAKLNNNLGSSYIQEKDYKKALSYLVKGITQWRRYLSDHGTPNTREGHLEAIFYLNIGECYMYTNKIDSSDHYLQICYQITKKKKFDDLLNNVECDLGNVELARNHKAPALKYLRAAVAHSILNEDIQQLSITYLNTAKLYHFYKQQDSAEYYARLALAKATEGKYLQDVLNAGDVLYGYYEDEHNLPEAFKYYKLTTAAKDSLYSQEKVKQLLSLDFDEKDRQREIVAAREQYSDKVRTNSLLAGLGVMLLLSIGFWRNGKQRQKANRILKNQKEEIESTLSKLQLTQKQLIQSEKMASLGELTAGIAHEIQNPLNFVSNFSEVSIELLEELKSEVQTGNKDDAIALADDLTQNLQKINHHGKRADFIVKGMLEHSRTSTGERRLTNLNILADEFLKLSYHGLRAKDKNFNAEMVTHFSDDLPKVNVAPQDIGRVLLNLFNNAFYAVNQKQKNAGPDYKPTVKVETFFLPLLPGSPTGQRAGGIKVKDNGNGIPDAIKDKIMQPFFTTKPTGEGTGLGLSLSYDIIVKGHGGSITVDTKEGEFTEFTVILPL